MKKMAFDHQILILAVLGADNVLAFNRKRRPEEAGDGDSNWVRDILSFPCSSGVTYLALAKPIPPNLKQKAIVSLFKSPFKEMGFKETAVRYNEETKSFIRPCAYPKVQNVAGSCKCIR